jgi:hypothetical protein
MQKLLFQNIVTSRTVPGKEYHVRLFEEDGQRYWECGCPAFLFRNPLKNACWHIKESINKLKITGSYLA